MYLFSIRNTVTGPYKEGTMFSCFQHQVFFPFSPFHEAYVPCKHRGIEELPATFNASASQTTAFVSTCQTSTHWHSGRRLIKMTSFGYVAFLLAGASAKYFHGKAVFIFHSNLVFRLVLLSLSSLTVVERQLWCTWV